MLSKKLNGALCQMLNYHFSDSSGACTHNLKVQDSTLECIDVKLNWLVLALKAPNQWIKIKEEEKRKKLCLSQATN